MAERLAVADKNRCVACGARTVVCSRFCGRGLLFAKLGGDCKCSRNKPMPKWLASKWFRYGFLIFFLTMFGVMSFNTYPVAAGAENQKEAIKLFWTFRVLWGWTYTADLVPDRIAQFAFDIIVPPITYILNL